MEEDFEEYKYYTTKYSKIIFDKDNDKLFLNKLLIDTDHYNSMIDTPLRSQQIITPEKPELAPTTDTDSFQEGKRRKKAIILAQAETDPYPAFGTVNEKNAFISRERQRKKRLKQLESESNPKTESPETKVKPTVEEIIKTEQPPVQEARIEPKKLEEFLTHSSAKEPESVSQKTEVKTSAKKLTKPRQIADTSKINPESIKSKVTALLKKLPAKNKLKLDFNDPQEIVTYLNEWVAGQEGPKKALALAFSDYMNSGIVNPVLLIGGSGTGKTYTTDLLCRAAGIPYAKISLANVTTEGYKGRNLTEGLEGLVGKDRGVIFFDEFDKLVSTDSSNPGFGPKLQRELLAIFTGERIKISGVNPNNDQLENESDEDEEPSFKGAVILYYNNRNKTSDAIREELDSRSILYDEIDMSTLSERSESDAKILAESQSGTVPIVKIDGKIINGSNIENVLEGLGIKTKKGKKKQIRNSTNVIDTSKYLIVCAGAFAGAFNAPSLQEIIQGRLGGNTCKLKKEKILEQLTDEDLTNYGLMPELVGRIKTKSVLHPQCVEELFRILKENKGSPYKQIVDRFEGYNIQLEITDDGLRRVAELALAGVGVRALSSVLEKLVEKYSFERKKYAGKNLTITKEEVDAEFKNDAEFAEIDDFEINWQNPQSIMEYLTIYVPGQQEAKKALSKAFYLYSMRQRAKNSSDIPQSNVLIVGPTGCGKTYSVEILAKKAKLPIVKVNLGNSHETLEKALSNFPKGQTKGIIYVDEADKVLMNPADPRNKSFIGYLENGTFNGLDLSGMLFILSGAFQPLYDRKTGDKTKLKVTRQDLETFGVSKEVLGRLPIIANIMPMSIDQLVEILKAPNSILKSYIDFFQQERESTINVDEGVYALLAEEALKTSQGARALKGVCDKLFDWYMFNSEPEQTYKINVETAKKILREEQ